MNISNSNNQFAKSNAILALGSNAGNKSLYIEKALSKLEAHKNITIAEQSKRYYTEPVNLRDNNTSLFLNMACSILTTLSPKELLDSIHTIEISLGRPAKDKRRRYISRTIDIDIIFYEDIIIESDDLTIPHGAWQDRDFVLRPLADLNLYNTYYLSRYSQPR